MEESHEAYLRKKTIKHPIFLAISIIIHLKDFVYHKRLFSEANVRIRDFEIWPWNNNIYYHCASPSRSSQRICCRASPICSTNGQLRMKIWGMYTLRKKNSAVFRYVNELLWLANAPRQDLGVPPTNDLFQACSAKQNTPWRYSHDPWLLVRRCKERKPKNWQRLKGQENIRNSSRVWENRKKPLVRFMTAPWPSLISVKHSIPSYPPLAIVVGSWSTRESPEGRHGGALIQPSARMADWWTVRWWVGKRSVIVGLARNLNAYEKSLMRMKETPNKDRYTISEPVRCYKLKWYLTQIN